MKRFTAIMILLLFFMFLPGCGNSDLELQKNRLQTEIDTLTEEINRYQLEIDTLKEIRNGLIESDDIVYLIELEISQSHFTLDIGEHLKDSMNKITIPIQVSEEYFYSVQVGDVLSDEFRIGSFVMKGSIGSWNIKVIDKQSVIKTE